MCTLYYCSSMPDFLTGDIFALRTVTGVFLANLFLQLVSCHWQKRTRDRSWCFLWVSHVFRESTVDAFQETDKN